MAQLEFTAGAITSTITASNAKAALAFKNAALARGYEGDIDDNQAVADFIMAKLRQTITDWSKEYQERVDVAEAIETVRTDPSIGFND